MRNVVFVAPFPMENTLRFARAASRLEGVRLLGVWQKPPPTDGTFADHVQVDDALDPAVLLAAVTELQRRHGKISRVLGVLEDLQVQLGIVRERLGVPGPGSEVADRFRDKSLMKEALRSAGLPCARHAILKNAKDGWAFAESIGLPLVLKPPSGAGCKATYRIGTAEDLTEALREINPSPARPVLAEEFLLGEEHSFETITLGGEPVFHSITRYLPTPLDAMRNPWIKWVCLAPRDIYGPEYDAIRKVGIAAVKSLGLQDGFTHMEWFRRPDGSVAIGEIAARPPGAQIMRLISEAYQIDAYRAWARASVDGAWDGPWERKFAAGVAFLRGPGQGRVRGTTGLEEAQKSMGSLVVEAELPKVGAPKSSSYEGDGYAIVRHPDTDVALAALRELIETVEVHYGP